MVGTNVAWTWSLWTAVIATVIALGFRGRDGIGGIVGAVTVGVAIVGPSVAWHVHRLHSGEVPRLASRHATVDVVVKLVRDPLPVAGSGLLVVNATVLHVSHGGEVNAPVLVLARGEAWSDLLPGQRVRMLGRFTEPHRGDDVAAVVDAVGVPVVIARAPWWQRVAGRARESLRRACDGLPDDERGLLPSLVDGDTTAVPSQLSEDMRTTGLSHLEAVSGENLGIVLGVTLAVMRTVGVRRRVRVLGAAAAICGFVVLARPSPSVQRAAVMSAVMLLAMLTGRRAAATSSLAAAVTVLVILNPFLARSIGFMLSVVATAGIVLLAPDWTRRLETRMPRPVAIALAVSAAAQLACTPVLLVAFGQLTPYAVPANLVAGPAVVPATVLGVVAALLAPISTSLVSPLVWLGGIATGVIAWVAHTFAGLPGAAATVPRVATIVVAGIATLVFAWAARRAEPVRPREIL